MIANHNCFISDVLFLCPAPCPVEMNFSGKSRTNHQPFGPCPRNLTEMCERGSFGRFAPGKIINLAASSKFAAKLHLGRAASRFSAQGIYAQGNSGRFYAGLQISLCNPSRAGDGHGRLRRYADYDSTMIRFAGKLKGPGGINHGCDIFTKGCAVNARLLVRGQVAARIKSP